MGTNYYLRLPGTNACKHCGRSDNAEDLHIGKSSHGWCFSLHVIPERGINDLDDWLPLFERYLIRDEYGEAITPREMLNIITKRGNPRGAAVHSPEWYASNGAEPGPNGLARHRIGSHCVKHGVGTWDCIPCDFS